MQQSHFNKIPSRQAEIKRAIAEGLQEQEQEQDHDDYAPTRHAIEFPSGMGSSESRPYPNDRRHRGYRRQPEQRSLRERLFPYEEIANPHAASNDHLHEPLRAHPPATIRRGPGLAEHIDNHARRFAR